MRVRGIGRHVPFGTRNRLADAVLRGRLTYLGRDALLDLWDVVREADRANRPGVIVEAGTALGGSAVVLARARRRDRTVLLYDVFGMIPPPSAEDGGSVLERFSEILSGDSQGIGGDTYYGYQPDLRRRVETTLRDFGVGGTSVQLVEGLYEDTLHPPDTVAVAHVDCDWYESVKVCLDRIWPHLARGGVVVVDDYDVWPGCRKAVDEFLAEKGDAAAVERRARLHIRRTA